MTQTYDDVRWGVDAPPPTEEATVERVLSELDARRDEFHAQLDEGTTPALAARPTTRTFRPDDTRSGFAPRPVRIAGLRRQPSR